MNFDKMTVEQLEKYRDEQQVILSNSRANFMAAGLVLQKKLQFSELADKRDDLSRQQVEIGRQLDGLGE